MSNITASVTTEKLRSIFATHRLPDTVVTDNGPTFTSNLFQEFMEKNGTAPYHPASNGLAEQAVETLKDGLRKMPGHILETKLSCFLFQYRITTHTTTGIPPAEMLMGRRPESHVDLLHPDEVEQELFAHRKSRKGGKTDRLKRGFLSLETVFFKNFSQGPPWLPGVICRQTGPVSFIVDLWEGRQICRHQDHLRVRHTAGSDRPQSVAHEDSSMADLEVPVAPQHNDGLSMPTDGETETEAVQVTQLVGSPSRLRVHNQIQGCPTKTRMQNIGNVSILGMFIMYFFTAVFGYLTFYENTEAELLHTYSKVDPLDTLILCVRLAVLVAVTLTVPVVLFPIRRALLQLLFPGKPFQWLRHITIAVCLLFAVNLLVILVPNIRDIFGITGATTAPSLIFILPGLFYIRIIPINQEPMNSRPRSRLRVSQHWGFIFMTMSLTFIGLDWMSGERRNLGH
ncbi:Sodium-coupled neutral amino acid transporter 3 [Nibea albiflora]|uniref:Sodium-coupled neutral amino acid transporter 3 n=1 Tax=Nibea albiflora TaxID=240163 RepID=A0ACB7EJZ7_NIBAL|nr:Sodium-coupled neutral amino acid transporter 3 [Nibea albiflora]